MLLNKIWSEISALSANNVEEIILNGGFTGVVLDDGSMGIAMNVRSGTEANEETRKLLHTCIGQSCEAVANKILEALETVPKNTPERFLLNSTLIAMCNALSQKRMTEEYLGAHGYHVEIDVQGGPASTLKEGEVATIVGYGGMVRPMSKIAKQTFVTELEPELFSSYRISKGGIEKGPTCTTVVPSSEQEKYFSMSDRIFLTGCTLVTDTMDDILTQCKGKHIVVYGGTAAFIPDALFEGGVESIHTMAVTNRELMTDILLNCAGAAERFFPMASHFILIEKK